MKSREDKHSPDWFHLINPAKCYAISATVFLFRGKKRVECLLAVRGEINGLVVIYGSTDVHFSKVEYVDRR